MDGTNPRLGHCVADATECNNDPTGTFLVHYPVRWTSSRFGRVLLVHRSIHNSDAMVSALASNWIVACPNDHARSRLNEFSASARLGLNLAGSHRSVRDGGDARALVHIPRYLQLRFNSGWDSVVCISTLGVS